VSAHIKKSGAAPLLIFFALPLTASLLFALGGANDLQAWASLFAHPQLWSALELSLFTGFVSSAFSLLMAVLIVSGLYQNSKLLSITGAMLSVPHLALAIGFSFLIMPSGFIARLISVFTDWKSPPNWISTHDPYGLSLTASLVLKETPFLIWLLASILNREDVRRSLAGQRAAALSLGHDFRSIWLRIFLPQILPKITWPLLVTFVYAATVIDMSLVIGPTQPPTLVAVVWADINDAQVVNNARGAVGAWFLTGAVAVVAAGIWGIVKLFSTRRNWLTAGPVGPPSPLEKVPVGRPFFLKRRRIRFLASLLPFKFSALIFTYIIITLALVLLSFATFWPFPLLWPETLSTAAWVRVVQNPSALVASLIFAFATTATALVLIVTWMECQSQSCDRFMIGLSAIALGLPAILLSLGQYRVFLQIGFTGTMTGLFIAHLVPVTAYMFIVLVGPYRSFDPRWRASATGLLAGFWHFLWAIKLPLLKAPLLAACAIGFAVSFGQYVPAQLIAAGRFSTLPMEAVTLTSGSNRPLTAAFALTLLVPPLLAFFAASYLSKPRWTPA
jgi:putative thiamine transport system permease protein